MQFIPLKSYLLAVYRPTILRGDVTPTREVTLEDQSGQFISNIIAFVDHLNVIHTLKLIPAHCEARHLEV